MYDIVDNIYSELAADMERSPSYPVDIVSRLAEIRDSATALVNIYNSAADTGIVDYDGVLHVTARLARLLYSIKGDNEVTQEHNDETIVIMN